MSAALVAVLCLPSVPTALADSLISLYLNGDRITPRDANGRVVPIPAVDGTTGQESRSILLTLDENEPKAMAYTRLNAGFIVCARNFLNVNSPTYKLLHPRACPRRPELRTL